MSIFIKSEYMYIAESKLMLVLCSVVICFVVIQAVLFYKKSYNRGKEIGMPTNDLKKYL